MLTSGPCLVAVSLCGGNDLIIFITAKRVLVVWIIFNQNLLTFWRKTSPARVLSSKIPFSASIIQYNPVQRNRNFPGIGPMCVWKTSTAFPTLKSFSRVPRCRSTNALRRHYSCSNMAMLRTRASPSSRSCCSQICSDWPSDSLSCTWIRKLGTWNSMGITTSNPYARRKGVDCILIL